MTLPVISRLKGEVIRAAPSIESTFAKNLMVNCRVWCFAWWNLAKVFKSRV